MNTILTALNAFTESLAHELRPFDVRVRLVHAIVPARLSTCSSLKLRFQHGSV